MSLPQSSASGNNPTIKPLIGITTRLDGEDNFYLRRYYAESIAASGGIPVYIPLIPDRRFLSELTAHLQGLVLSGSNSDMDPAYFGEEPHPRLGSVIPERDQTDLILLELAETNAMPVLAICFGMQSLCVSRGGSLIQHIESEITSPIKHEQGQVYDRPSHSINIDPESWLGRIAGADKVRVNSSHHQSVREPGRDLKVIARAPDGVIEAVMDQRPDRFVLGVQWHPELAWQRDELSQKIFSGFIEAILTGE